MKRFAAIAVLTAGCLSPAGVATFRSPAERLAGKLAASAPKPVARLDDQIDSLDGAWRIEDRVLLDLRGESGSSRSFRVSATCGPLVLWNGAARQKVWSVARPEGCADKILRVDSRITLVGHRERDGKLGLELATLALDSGAVVASVPLKKGALAQPAGDGVILVEGAPGDWKVSLRAGAALTPTWEVALDDPGETTRIALVGGSVVVFGARATAIDRARGAKLRSTAIRDESAVLDVVTGGDAAYAIALSKQLKFYLLRVTADGAIPWTNVVKGVVDSANANQVFLAGGHTVVAIAAADGHPIWTAKLSGLVSGTGLTVGQLLLMPTTSGVAAVDIATGEVRFTAAPFGSRDHARSDRLTLIGDATVLLDTAVGLAALDFAHQGQTRWSIAVRSLPHAQRQARVLASGTKVNTAAQEARAGALLSRRSLADSLSGSGIGGMSVGMASMAGSVASYMEAMGAIGWVELSTALKERRNQHADVAFEQARLDEQSPLVLRPISWSTGRGVLAVRKSDGAFREIVIGPPDVYEDPFRASSIAVLAGRTVVTVAEGVDPSQWRDLPERAPVQLVARSVMVYSLEDGDLKPASEYERASIVPLGSFALPPLPAGEKADEPPKEETQPE
jgi:hypothetical protein